MKTLVFLIVILCSISSAFAQGYQYVQPYTRSNGTYVPGYYRTTPNSNPYDNWSTKGNTNPFTGQPGYQDPYKNTYPSYQNTHPNNSNNYYNNGF